MKVLLTQHVKKVGRVGEIVEVSDGYATNSLIPQKKAVVATPKIINEFQTKEKALQDKEKKEKITAYENLKKLNGEVVIIKEKLNLSGSLYHALGAKEIIKAVYDQCKINISNEYFPIKVQLKHAGEHSVMLEHHGNKAILTVVIEGI